MVIMPHAKLHFNRLMLTLIFGLAWRTTEKAGPDRVKTSRTFEPCALKPCNSCFKNQNEESFNRYILYFE